MRSKKKVLGSFNGSFLRNLVGGGNSFFIFFKEGLLKNSSKLIFVTKSAYKFVVNNSKVNKPQSKRVLASEDPLYNHCLIFFKY